MTNGANGHHVPIPPTQDPEQELHRRAQGSPVLLILAALSGGTLGSVGTYGVTHRSRPPCVAAAKECTCPSCPSGQACYKATCTCVAVAAEAVLREVDTQRRLRALEQRLAGECGGNITEVELR